MTTDFLIIGQGIAGTLLSFRLLQAGHSVVVIDDGSKDKASRVAGAVINPLSGKSWKKTTDADLYLPLALDCYRELEQQLACSILRELPLYVFDAPEVATLQPLDGGGSLTQWFHIGEKPIATTAVWLVDAAVLLDRWRNYLQETGRLSTGRFEEKYCSISQDKVHYKDIEAGSIVFCEGAAAAHNKRLSSLPFTRNRGEALLLDIPSLSAGAVYHYSTLRLVPQQQGLFWCGSNYRWQYDDLRPDEAWRREAEETLSSWLKVPFIVKDHIVAERPTTAGQIPLVGLHPQQLSVGFLNGLGTRGFSAGPFWAAELARKLTDRNYAIRNYNESWLRQQFR